MEPGISISPPGLRIPNCTRICGWFDRTAGLGGGFGAPIIEAYGGRSLLILRRMRELVHQESQFIIATHSPILLAYPNAKILLLDRDGYKQVAYKDTEHYRLTRQFLNDPDKALKDVFAANGELFPDF